MTAKVGETVLIVHSQANRDSRPHLIGGHGDYVWETGKFINSPEKDLETSEDPDKSESPALGEAGLSMWACEAWGTSDVCLPGRKKGSTRRRGP
jgi:hypothetical protein